MSNASDENKPTQPDREDAGPSPPSDDPKGATIATAYVARSVKAYAVTEAEIQTLSMFNAQALSYSSIGAALLSFAVGIWTNYAFVNEVGPMGEITAKLIGPAFFIGSLVFFVLGFLAIRSRNKSWEAIKG